MYTKPSGYEAEFCVVRGQTSNEKQMLERVAGGLLRAVESLAEAEIRLYPFPEYRVLRFYQPIIVTNARLQVCFFDKRDIELGSGGIRDDQAVFEEVPFVRFRKSLSTSFESKQMMKNIKEVHKDSERTVYVVNIFGLSKFLEEWRSEVPGVTFSKTPWSISW